MGNPEKWARRISDERSDGESIVGLYELGGRRGFRLRRPPAPPVVFTAGGAVELGGNMALVLATAADKGLASVVAHGALHAGHHALYLAAQLLQLGQYSLDIGCTGSSLTY